MYKYFSLLAIIFINFCASSIKSSKQSEHQIEIKKSQDMLYLKQALYSKIITKSEYDSLESRLINPALEVDFSKILDKK